MRAPPSRTEERQRFLDRLHQQRATAAAELGIDLSQPLEHADSARLDRHALAVVLEALGYVSYRRGSRITRKPSRPTADDLEKRAAKHVPDASPDSSLAQRASACRHCSTIVPASTTAAPRRRRPRLPRSS